MKQIPVGTFVIGAPSSSSGKGKSPLSDAQAKAEAMLSEYRHALNDGLGVPEGEAFGLACLQYLGDQKNVGVAWLASQHVSTCSLAVLIGPNLNTCQFGCSTWLGTIALLVLLLLIPLLMIDGLTRDRQHTRDEVLMDIARSSSNSQRIAGPVMVVPHRKTVREWKLNEKLNERYEDTHEVRGRLYFLPERFQLEGRVPTELRARGIYEASFTRTTILADVLRLPHSWASQKILLTTGLNKRLWQ